MPNKPPGDYGSASGPLNVTLGPNSDTYAFKLPVSDLGGQSSIPHGSYTIQISVSKSQFSAPIATIEQTVSE
jgi:hypothetical protein